MFGTLRAQPGGFLCHLGFGEHWGTKDNRGQHPAFPYAGGSVLWGGGALATGSGPGVVQSAELQEEQGAGAGCSNEAELVRGP